MSEEKAKMLNFFHESKSIKHSFAIYAYFETFLEKTEGEDNNSPDLSLLT